jgi:hypothetical protein
VAIRGKAGQTERANQDLYRDVVTQTVTLQEQNVRFALSFTGVYMSLFFAPLSSLQNGLQSSSVFEGAGSEKTCGSLPLRNYDELTTEDVYERIEDLDALEVRAVRSYERRHKNRGELLERLDRSLV